jgi:hypothetical protein
MGLSMGTGNLIPDGPFFNPNKTTMIGLLILVFTVGAFILGVYIGKRTK